MKYTKYNKRTDYNQTVAREAYKMVTECGSCQFLATETLEAAMQEADERVFCAEMSDDYSVTRAERAAIHDDVYHGYVELVARRQSVVSFAA